MRDPGWIDLHCHYAAPGFPAAARRALKGAIAEVITDGVDNKTIVNHGRTIHFVKDELYHLLSLEHRLAAMDERGAQIQVISPPNFFYSYSAPPDVGALLCGLLNEGLFEAVRAHPTRLLAMPAVPLQDPSLAIAELQRVSGIPGVVAITVGSNINGRGLDEPVFWPFYEAAEAMDMPIFIHPMSSDIAGADRMGDYFLRNMVGNPLDTTLAAAKLMFGGVLDQFPGLRFCLSHGGGYLAWAVGRFGRGFQVHQETRTRTSSDPRQLIRRYYVDTIVHSQPALAYLLSQFGDNRVVCGSDYPFEIGDPDPGGNVRRLELGKREQALVLRENALAFLRPQAAAAILPSQALTATEVGQNE